MNNSAERNNPEVFPGNRTGGIHCRKSLISSSNKKRKKHNTTKNKTQQKTKQNKTKNKQKPAITKNAFSVRSRRLRGLFPTASRRNLCKQRSGEQRFGS